VPVRALDGHAIAEFPGDPDTAEGAKIIGSSVTEQHSDGRMVVMHAEQCVLGAPFNLFPQEVEAEGPTARRMFWIAVAAVRTRCTAPRARSSRTRSRRARRRCCARCATQSSRCERRCVRPAQIASAYRIQS
jgi:hypothetical protein